VSALSTNVVSAVEAPDRHLNPLQRHLATYLRKASASALVPTISPLTHLDKSAPRRSAPQTKPSESSQRAPSFPTPVGAIVATQGCAVVLPGYKSAHRLVMLLGVARPMQLSETVKSTPMPRRAGEGYPARTPLANIERAHAGSARTAGDARASRAGARGSARAAAVGHDRCRVFCAQCCGEWYCRCIGRVYK
jgi:hypothetical protein